MESGNSIWSAAVLLFLLMDPIGNIPILLAVLKDIELRRQRTIIIRELLIALGILVFFIFTGRPMLNFMHLQKEAVTIAGGIILLIIGLRMIFPKPEGVMGQTPGGEPFLVPIAIPMIAGPSVLSMLILMTQGSPGNRVSLVLSLVIAWIMSFLILLVAPALIKVLKQRGLIALERFMGMILVMMAVQMLLDGFRQIL
jgi:multiple antibiotic resistance protein